MVTELNNVKMTSGFTPATPAAYGCPICCRDVAGVGGVVWVPGIATPIWICEACAQLADPETLGVLEDRIGRTVWEDILRSAAEVLGLERMAVLDAALAHVHGADTLAAVWARTDVALDLAPGTVAAAVALITGATAPQPSEMTQ